MMQALSIKTFTPIAWDRAGIAGSLLCIAHCIATPLLAAALPVLAVYEKGTHISLTIALMCIGLLAFLPGYRHHNKPHMALVAAIGFAMLVLAVFIPERLAREMLETGLTVVGGMLLVSAHVSNAYFCRRCCVCTDQPCSQP